MNATVVPSNGVHYRRKPLASYGAAQARPAFGSQNVTTTGTASSPVAAACAQLFPQVLEELRRRGQPPESINWDELHPEGQIDEVLAKLGNTSLGDARPETTDQFLRDVQAAHQQQPTRMSLRMREVIDEVTDRGLTRLRGRIQSLSHCSPEDMRLNSIIVARNLRQSKPQARDCAGQIQAAFRLLERVREVEQRQTDFAPDDRASILGHLQDAARTMAREAQRAFVQGALSQQLVANWPRLIRLVEGIGNLAGESLGRVEELGRECQRWVHEEQTFLKEPACATVLMLPGTEADEALAGLRKRHEFATNGELVHYVNDRWLGKLRDHLAGRVEFDTQQAGLLQLLNAIPVPQAFALFREWFADELRSETLSVYGRLRLHGVGDALNTLIERSALTSDPGPRGTTRFGVNPFRIRIVSLPEVVRPEDQAVSQQIQQELSTMEGIEIVRHSAAFDELVVHQIGGGWPWQILPSNDHLIVQHLEAARSGYESNLIGILKDAPDGSVLPQYQEKQHGQS